MRGRNGALHHADNFHDSLWLIAAARHWCQLEGTGNLASRVMILIASLLAIFLGALDALIVATAMPTIVSELGGLEWYSWVFSGYMLTRTVALPIFGKLCDMYSTRKLFTVTMGLFIISSALAGIVSTMPQLILLRTVQGFAAGGTFAIAYTVVVGISPPDQRGRMMGFISFVWGIASVLGPVLGGLIVTYVRWPWVFYINVPVGGAALLAVLVYLREFREKRPDASIDYAGATLLSAGVWALLFGVLLGGVRYSWASPQILGLLFLAILLFGSFLYAESRAANPILHLQFFRIRDFVLGSTLAFLCSFAIFSLIAFIPLFVQGALAKPVAQVSIAMIPLSLGWSVGGLISGNLINRLGHTVTSIFGSLLICAGIAIALTFSPHTSLALCCATFGGVGIGMGFVFISTLIMAQTGLPPQNLGVATASQQFALNLGGTVGVGISGAVLLAWTTTALSDMASQAPSLVSELSSPQQLSHRIQEMLRPGFDSSLSPEMLKTLQDAVSGGVIAVFWLALGVGLLSFLLSLSALFTKQSR